MKTEEYTTIAALEWNGRRMRGAHRILTCAGENAKTGRNNGI